MKGFLCKIFFLGYIVTQAAAFNILPAGPKAEVVKGESVELSCVADKAWSFCQWSHNGATCNTASQSTATNCQMGGKELDRIVWIRKESPVKNFACTIKILAAEMRDTGSWSCLLIAQDMNQEQADYTYDVTVFEETSLAFSARPYKEMIVGNQYNIECSGAGGTPEPNISAAVGKALDQSQDKNLELLQSSTLQNPDTGVKTYSKVFNFVPSHSDQLLDIKCISTQSRENGAIIFPPKILTQPFQIVFLPLPNSTPLSKFVVREGEDAEITITFYAHPPPRSDQIIWNFVREESVKSESLTAGSTTDKFIAKHPEILGPFGVGTQRFGEVNATLIIKGVTMADIKAYSYLEVSNIHGKNSFDFEMTFDQPLIHPTNRPSYDDEEDPLTEEGLGIGTLVGIIVAIALVVIIVIVIIVVLYKNEKACFGSTRIPSKDEYFHVNAKDVEMQNMNASGIVRANVGNKNRGQPAVPAEMQANVKGHYLPSSEQVDRNIPDLTQQDRNDQSFSNADQLSPLPNPTHHSEFSGDKRQKMNPTQRDSYQIATAKDKYDQRESTYLNAK